MDIKKKISNNNLYIKLIGDLDEYSAHYSKGIIDRLLDENRTNCVIFDLAELDFMDSTGIGMFLGRYKKLKNKKIPVYISNPNNNIEKIFKMSGIYEIIPKIS